MKHNRPAVRRKLCLQLYSLPSRSVVVEYYAEGAADLACWVLDLATLPGWQATRFSVAVHVLGGGYGGRECRPLLGEDGAPVVLDPSADPDALDQTCERLWRLALASPRLYWMTVDESVPF